jgi:cytochrome c5
MLEIVDKCPLLKYDVHNELCEICHGTNIITRPPTQEEVNTIAERYVGKGRGTMLENGAWMRLKENK